MSKDKCVSEFLKIDMTADSTQIDSSSYLVVQEHIDGKEDSTLKC